MHSAGTIISHSLFSSCTKSERYNTCDVGAYLFHLKGFERVLVGNRHFPYKVVGRVSAQEPPETLTLAFRPFLVIVLEVASRLFAVFGILDVLRKDFFIDGFDRVIRTDWVLCGM